MKKKSIQKHQPKRKPGAGDPDERATPRDFFDSLHAEYNFTIDACANNRNTKLARFWTKEQDGLAQSWRGETVWCNPPYSNIGAWVAKASELEADLCVMLVPAWTDRSWWHDFIEPFRDLASDGWDGAKIKVRFLEGRIKFSKPGKCEGDGPAPFGCVLIYFRRGRL